MPNADIVAQRLETLLSQRKQHADAIVAIDVTLAKIAGVLLPGEGTRRVGRPRLNPIEAPVKVGRKRRKRSRFAVSGNDSILAFVKANPDVTTQEIKKHWASEGRGGGADNALSLLTKAKKLKRTALGKGIRGSSYTA
jgi:hypothetical protein